MIFNCGEIYFVMDEGVFYLEVMGFLFVLMLDGYVELDVGSNDNIIVVYKDLFDYEINDIFMVFREWSIIDECDLDMVNIFI